MARRRRAARPSDPFALRATMAVVDRLRRPLRAYGVDFPAFRAVLLAKLRTDVRPRREGAAVGFASKGLLVIAGTNLLLSTTVSMLAAISPGPFAFMAIVQGMVMFMVFLTLVVDFTQILFAVDDAAVLGHHPIADRTLFAAQLAHTGVYLTTVVGALTLVPTLTAAVLFPPWIAVPAMLLATVLASGLAVLFVVVTYGTAMRLVGPERFRNVLLTTQIGVLAFCLGGHQVINVRHAWREALWAYVVEHPASMYLIPPCWFGGLFEVCLGTAGVQSSHLAGLSLLVPLAALGIGLGLSSSGFVASLTAPDARTDVGTSRGRTPLGTRIGRLVTLPGSERAGYEFAHALMKRENLFRKQAWPGLIAFWIMALAFQLGGDFEAGSDLRRATLVGSSYFLMAAAQTFLLQLRYSETPDASWLFRIAPLAERGRFVAGASKAVAFGVVLPLLPLALSLPLALGGAALIPDLLLVAEVTLAACLLSPRLLVRRMPFTERLDPRDSAGKLGTMMLLGVLLGAALLAHLVLSLVPLLVAVSAVALLPVLVLLNRGLRDLHVSREVY